MNEFHPTCFYKTIDMLNKYYKKKFKIPKEAYETAWEELNALIWHKRDRGQKTKKGLQKFIEKLKKSFKKRFNKCDKNSSYL